MKKLLTLLLLVPALAWAQRTPQGVTYPAEIVRINDSAVQYNLAPTSLVSGDIVEQSFFNSTNQSAGAPTQEQFSFIYQLEREPFTGVPYEYVITMATTGTNQDIYASIEWQEIS